MYLYAFNAMGAHLKRGPDGNIMLRASISENVDLRNDINQEILFYNKPKKSDEKW